MAFKISRRRTEREDSWNASELEFLAPRLVRNGSRAVLCFYDRRAHRLPPPYAYFPRQMALRYCTHAVYHAPFALHDDRLAYRNPGFDRQFGMPELARVARLRGYGTQLLFTVGGEDTDNANWSRLASDEVRRETFAKDLKETLVTLGYDGVNLHWSTPGGRCGRAGDAHALTDLVRLLRTRLRRPLAPRDFLLVVTLPPQEHFVEVASQLAPLAKLTDFVVVQAHSMYGPSSPWPRCASPYEAVQGPSVRALLDSLAARLFHGHWGKLCITHSLAAVTYRLADYGTAAVGAIVGDISEGDGASAGPGEPQSITGTPGKAAYFEVCGWTRQRSRSRECSMLRSGSTVAALEGPEALRHKLARMALDGHGRLCLAALDTHLDDPLGACGGAMSPLLKRLYEDPLET
ncbi:chitotriosidase-1-like [Rhipicephalus microplus]|uniref:chitotriosidase-1-like n=1 Tax=Rhipicephalus microplus TaxID=6941 RepID=UPI003F6C2544